MTSDTAEKLIFRPKENFDGAMPCGNSACAVLFDLLWRYTGEEKYRSAQKNLLESLCAELGKYPAGSTYALTALIGAVFDTKELVCASADGKLPQSLKAVMAKYAPEMTLLLKTPENAKTLEKIAPFTAQMQPQSGKSACYICQNGACSLPVTVL